MRHFLSALVLLGLVPLLRAGGETENPFKKAKVGDWAEYKLTTGVAGNSFEGKVRMEVTAASETEVTLKTSSNVKGMELPSQESKIDLTKPYDPTSASLPKGAQAKVKKTADGKEKIKIGGKEYDATWQKMTINANANGLDFEAENKFWMSKNIPLSGMLKMEMNATILGMEVKSSLEYTGSGSK